MCEISADVSNLILMVVWLRGEEDYGASVHVRCAPHVKYTTCLLEGHVQKKKNNTNTNTED